jgi:hypothetical protein
MGVTVDDGAQEGQAGKNCRNLDFGFWGAGFGFRVSGFGFRVSGFGFLISGFGCRESGFGFRILCFWGFRNCVES